MQIGAGDVAHRQVKLAVVLTGLVDGNDVWLFERRGDTRLRLEATTKAVVVGQLGREELQCDATVEPIVAREIHDPHATAPDNGFDHVPVEMVSLEELHAGIITGRQPRTMRGKSAGGVVALLRSVTALRGAEVLE